MSKRTPACIEHGFCHSCLSKGGGVYVADDDQKVFASETCRLLVKMVAPRVRDFCVDRTDPFLVSGALRDSQKTLVFPVMPQGRDMGSIRHRSEVLQAEINADMATTSRQIIGHLALERHVPAATGIFDERTRFYFSIQFPRLPERKVALEVNGLVLPNLNRASDKRDPAKSTLWTETGSEFGAPTMLVTRFDELTADAADRIRVKPDIGRTTGGEFDQVESRRPPRLEASLSSALRLALGGDAKIPHLVACDAVPPKMTVPAFNAVLEGHHRHS